MMTKAPLPDSVWSGQVSLIIFQAVIFFLKWKSRAIFCICIGVLGNVFVKNLVEFCVIHRKNVYLHRISVNQSLQHVFFGDSATPQRALIVNPSLLFAFRGRLSPLRIAKIQFYFIQIFFLFNLRNNFMQAASWLPFAGNVPINADSTETRLCRSLCL